MTSALGIARRLVRLRASYGWRQADLAARLGVRQSAVSQWECGIRRPRRLVVVKIEGLEDGIAAVTPLPQEENP